MSKWTYISNCAVLVMDIVMMIKNYQYGDYAWACAFAGLFGCLLGVTLTRFIDDWRSRK